MSKNFSWSVWQLFLLCTIIYCGGNDDFSVINLLLILEFGFLESKIEAKESDEVLKNEQMENYSVVLQRRA